MRSPAKQRVLAVLVGCLVDGFNTHYVAAQRRTPITITRLYTGADGQAHAGRIEVSMMPSATLAGLEGSEMFKVASAQLVRWPPGHVRDWHNAEQRQYVVALSGLGEVEVSGGQKILLDPGRIILVEDLTGKGHVTRSVGREDLVLLLVPFAAQ
jgi:quercetin dioxygenase-like cupin family protein